MEIWERSLLLGDEPLAARHPMDGRPVNSKTIQNGHPRWGPTSVRRAVNARGRGCPKANSLRPCADSGTSSADRDRRGSQEKASARSGHAPLVHEAAHMPAAGTQPVSGLLHCQQPPTALFVAILS